MGNWFVSMKKADFQGIAARYHISPIVARLIRNRNVVGDENIDLYLNGTIAELNDGMLLKDVDRAVDILTEKIEGRAQIRVIGDYDIDGVNATYILQEGLEGLGAVVDTDIPDRIRDGYGLNRTLINRAIEDGIDTIITCDNGIAAGEEIAYGKSQGLTIIVTDHHEVPYEETEEGRKYILPPADAVVDPKQVDCTYPFQGLCGAAVAYKLMQALYDSLGKDEEEIDYLMENVAVATIGDVMDLVDENRIFVRQGLEMLKRTKNPGWRALMECTNIDVEHLSAYHIGFVLGPCINAGGRLDTAKRALELLSSNSKKEAALLAGDLKALNDSRKEMTAKNLEEAVELVESTPLGQDKVLVVFLPDCHESIAGIVAGKLRERYYKPVYVLTKGKDGVKGSGRSIPNYDMFEELSKCRELLTRFGGHKMAAGLSLKEEQVDRLRILLNEQTGLTPEDLVEKISIDMQLPFAYITEHLIEELKVLEPFGKGNPKPLFAEREVRAIHPRILGVNQNVLKCRLQSRDGVEMDAVYFGDVKACLEYMNAHERIAVTFYPGINEYKGNRTIQITIVNYQ
ncbi:single-stranded-DNA-specific exonuclease RecJ [Hespellia stercorisuis]|uniref:Single-stranded-DNA-specific exonuclease RecJ n=1 Tax=Hespellia stercorisuis DSM 15480 TaxID=1121950 RepID=A0A1M6IJA2_9FIRM|nr:single-stranded-DNA-specific exonuclease RecJ [Hespellia stercorisuis]SHJ34469.1 exonuclease RecJ [Hespellia stercorisuis DSM 15480]